MKLRISGLKPKDPHISAVRRAQEITIEFTAHQITSHQQRPSRDRAAAETCDDDASIIQFAVTDADDFLTSRTVAHLAQRSETGTEVHVSGTARWVSE